MDPSLYGGLADWSEVTNIVFSNGLLDPWSSAGVSTAPSTGITILTIPEGAHHLVFFLVMLMILRLSSTFENKL